MRLRATSPVFQRSIRLSIWLVATLLLAWTMPTHLLASAVDIVVRTRVALLVAPSPQDNAPLTNSSHNATSRHITPPICAEAQRAEHRFGRGGGAEGAGGVGIPNDKTGNLYETGTGAETRVYAKGNRLIQKGNTQYAWDADGRMIEKRTVEPQPGLDAPKEEIWKYTWNGAGLMERASRSDGLIVECAYDPFARRIEKKVYEQKSKLAVPTLKARTRFVWDGDVLVHEIREAGLEKSDPVVEERTYWFEDDGFEPLAHREKRVDDVGREHGGWFHYVNDPIGTPERLLAEDGSIATEYERKAWGQLEAKGGARADTPIRLQGQYWDEETGLAYNFHRFYDPSLGTFISADALGLGGGTNEFAYRVNPIIWSDPVGLNAGKLQGGTFYLVDKYPPGSRESRQLRRFVKAWNEEIQKNGGSMTRRCETPQETRESKTWKAKMQREQPHRFGGKVVGHVPDACAGGKSKDTRAMALDGPVNSYIGATFAGNTAPGESYSSVEVVRELPP